MAGQILPVLALLAGTAFMLTASGLHGLLLPLRAGIEGFWDRVGRNMRDPVWEWGEMYVDVLSPDAAVLTATYRVPHRTPEGAPHVIGGAWTMVFARRDGSWRVIQEHLSDLPPEPEPPTAQMPGMDMSGERPQTQTRPEP